MDIIRVKAAARAAERKLEEQIAELRTNLGSVQERAQQQESVFHQALAAADEALAEFQRLVEVDNLAALPAAAPAATTPRPAPLSARPPSSFRQSAGVPVPRRASVVDRAALQSPRYAAVNVATAASPRQTPRATFSPVIKSIPSLTL